MRRRESIDLPYLVLSNRTQPPPPPRRPRDTPHPRAASVLQQLGGALGSGRPHAPSVLWSSWTVLLTFSHTYHEKKPKRFETRRKVLCLPYPLWYDIISRRSLLFSFLCKPEIKEICKTNGSFATGGSPNFFWPNFDERARPLCERSY